MENPKRPKPISQGLSLILAVGLLGSGLRFPLAAQARPIPPSQLVLSDAIGRPQARPPFFQTQKASPGLDAVVLDTAMLDAIIQLQGLTLPPIKTQGQDQLPLTPYGRTNVFTLEATLASPDKPPDAPPYTGTFLVDTGASTTLLSRELVESLALAGEAIPGDRLASAVAGKNCPSMDANLYPLPPLQLGAVQVSDLRGLKFTDTQIPPGLSGVLGMNFLRPFDLRINPRDQWLELLSPSPLPAKHKALAVPLEERLGVMLAQVYLNGTGPYQMLIDTGAGSTFISPQVLQQSQLTDLPQEPIQIQGFCGLENAKRLQVPTLRLGLQTVAATDVIVLEGASVIQTLAIDGILGQNVLNQFFQHWRFPAVQSDGEKCDRPKSKVSLIPKSTIRHASVSDQKGCQGSLVLVPQNQTKNSQQ